MGVVPKRGKFSLGLLRNNGTGLERLVTVSLMVGAVCSIIGVRPPPPHPTTTYHVTAQLHPTMLAASTSLPCIIALPCIMECNNALQWL